MRLLIIHQPSWIPPILSLRGSPESTTKQGQPHSLPISNSKPYKQLPILLPRPRTAFYSRWSRRGVPFPPTRGNASGRRSGPHMHGSHAPAGRQRDWWHYLCHCPEVDEAGARLRGALAGACKAFAGDPAEGIWANACHAIAGGPRHAASERELILAVAVSVATDLEGGQARRTAQRMLDDVHSAAAAVIAASQAVDRGRSAAAEADYKARKAARAIFRTWARLAARAGPGAARILASWHLHEHAYRQRLLGDAEEGRPSHPDKDTWYSSRGLPANYLRTGGSLESLLQTWARRSF
jgi:hypothetical protein